MSIEVKNISKFYGEQKALDNVGFSIKKGEIVGVPYISNADSMAYNKSKVGGDIDTWDALFDSQFKGYAAMQNDSGPTLTTTAVYLKESGKQDIVNPSDMSKSEVKGVCEFLINMKKKGQFRTFWDGFGNGVGSAWTALEYFTTEDDCPNVGNLQVSSAFSTQATFTWNGSNGAYSFTRIKARVDTNNGTWFNVGGTGVNYGTFTKNKNGLNPGTSYRAQARTWCDPAGGPWKSPQWTSLIYWTQPTIRLEGGSTIANLEVYPNPSNDEIHISSNVSLNSIALYDILGKLILRKVKDTNSIDVSNLNAGVYILVMHSENEKAIKKVTVK